MFSNLEKLTIPEGEVVKITAGGVTLWEQTGSLPSAYQRVEWVRAEASYASGNNGSYIKLGFTFDTAARFKIGFYAESTTPTYLFGAAENSGTLRCMISAPYGGGMNGTLYGSNGIQFNGYEIGLVSGFNEWECTLKKGLIRGYNLTTDKTVSYTSQGSYTMTNELYLLGQNYNGTPRFGGARQVSYFEYYDKNDELICSLTPCYRKSDGVIGMYDTVRKLFLTNAGSGSFTKGAEIELLNITNRTYVPMSEPTYVESGDARSIVYSECYAVFKDGRRGAYPSSKISDFTTIPETNGFSFNASSGSGYGLEFPVKIVGGKTYSLNYTLDGGVGGYVYLLKFNKDTTLVSSTPIHDNTNYGAHTLTITPEDGYLYSIAFVYTNPDKTLTVNHILLTEIK